MTYSCDMRVPSFVVRLAHVLSLVCALVLLGSAAVRALIHLRDLTGIQHIAGVWMALAQYSEAGILYPPLEAEGVYAGTRYMPLCFAVIARLAPLVGDYVVAAKLMALATMVMLLAGVFVAVRRITGRTRDALILTGLVLALPEALAALLSPHADALAAALAVAGLLVISQCRMQNAECRMKARGSHSVLCILHSAFFVAALMTKFSAIAGPAAAGVFLWRQDRKRAVWLLVLWAVLSASGLALLEHVSEGRFLDNFRSLGPGGMSLDSIRIGPARVGFALRQSLPVAALVALAVATLFQRGRAQGFSLWDWYFLTAAAVTMVIFTSPGTGLNHLLELEVAAVLVIAQLLADPAIRGAAARLVVLAVLLAGVYDVGCDLGCPPGPGAVPGRLVAAALPPDARVLAEDATVPVLLGQQPVVMDPFAFRVLAERGRVDDRLLAERIARHEFDVLVLMGRVDRPEESLCPRFHFGARVTAAMRAAYRFDRQVGPYYLFVPEAAQDLSFTDSRIGNATIWRAGLRKRPEMPSGRLRNPARQ
jgi:hypothetical protein